MNMSEKMNIPIIRILSCNGKIVDNNISELYFSHKEVRRE
jgi:hypothetical protein